MATKAELIAQGYERISEQIISDWFEARAEARVKYWNKGRSAMLVKEAGGWVIYALPVATSSVNKPMWHWREEI
jgi:hypothetical protein